MTGAYTRMDFTSFTQKIGIVLLDFDPLTHTIPGFFKG